MQLEYYEMFLHYIDRGQRKKASEALAIFINSFANDEKKSWVWSYLKSFDKENPPFIRYEIFRDLVYPVLKEGYLQNDIASTIWLAILYDNIYNNKYIYNEVNLTSIELLEKCINIDPQNNEAKKLLLTQLIRRLVYCIHEWPSGILYGNNGASIEECQEIRDSIYLAQSLDVHQEHEAFLKDFIDKLNQYERRLLDWMAKTRK